MSTGEGIFWATVLILFVLGIRHISKTHRWKLIVAIAGVVVVLGLLVGTAMYFYSLYRSRPVLQNSFFGITLGMEPVDVLLVLGKPVNEIASKNTAQEEILSYTYQTYSWEGIDKLVRFGRRNNVWQVYLICDLDPNGELYSLNTFTSESDVRKRFGEPSQQSINQDGLRKFLTFEHLNMAVEIEKNSVTTVCVTDSSVNYKEEYSKSNIY